MEAASRRAEPHMEPWKSQVSTRLPKSRAAALVELFLMVDLCSLARKCMRLETALGWGIAVKPTSAQAV